MSDGQTANGPKGAPEASRTGAQDPAVTGDDTIRKDPEMLLTFRLQGERFALRVIHVNEILDPIARTRVPHASRYAPALINVRGTVVPLFDIRRRLDLAPEDNPDDARIVVLDVRLNDEMTRLALPVDAVENVIETATDKVEALPELGARWPKAFIEGVAFHNDQLVILLDTDALFDILPKSAGRAA